MNDKLIILGWILWISFVTCTCIYVWLELFLKEKNR